MDSLRLRMEESAWPIKASMSFSAGGAGSVFEDWCDGSPLVGVVAVGLVSFDLSVGGDLEGGALAVSFSFFKLCLKGVEEAEVTLLVAAAEVLHGLSFFMEERHEGGEGEGGEGGRSHT
eukprot:6506403-Ditylum_brightwellii.AAC.1